MHPVLLWITPPHLRTGKKDFPQKNIEIYNALQWIKSRPCDDSENNESNRSTSNNITVIEVSSTPNGNVFSFNGINEELENIDRNSSEVTNVSVMPINSNSENNAIRRPTNIECQDERINQNNSTLIFLSRDYSVGNVFS